MLSPAAAAKRRHAVPSDEMSIGAPIGQLATDGGTCASQACDDDRGRAESVGAAERVTTDSDGAQTSDASAVNVSAAVLSASLVGAETSNGSRQE